MRNVHVSTLELLPADRSYRQFSDDQLPLQTVQRMICDLHGKGAAHATWCHIGIIRTQR